MGKNRSLRGRYIIVNEPFLREWSNRSHDPRHIFFRAILENNTFEAYEAAIGQKSVEAKTYRTGPVSGHMTIVYALKRGWIESEQGRAITSDDSIRERSLEEFQAVGEKNSPWTFDTPPIAPRGYRGRNIPGPIGAYFLTASNGRLSVSKFKIPAARVIQGSLVLYATSLKVGEIVSEKFYSVETLDPDDKNDKGYQRVLNTARAKRLADYIVKGQDSKDAFLPTSVFLATDKFIPFNEEDNTIEIDTSAVCPFSVVDGQHRIEGLKMAAQKDPRVLDFEVPVNIAINLPRIAQMCHFLIVNTTQKSVDKAVEQRIIARLTEALDLEDIPSLPKWILNTVQKGEVDKAISPVER